MHDQPSQAELIDAVKRFIDDTASPQLTGHAAFHARVASNVLATLQRDLAAREMNDTEEAERLQSLLKRKDSLPALNKILCEQIRSGEMTAATPGLIAHLKATAIAQVKVDQPKYSGLKTALESS